MHDAHDLAAAASRWFGRGMDELGEPERRVLKSAFHRPMSRAPAPYAEKFGDRLADRVATLGGSWGFLIGFGLFLAAWAVGNLGLGREAFDPYPFIFLNLMLSMLAAAQAPVIMMSQNRQAAKDRADAGNDYEVNLKAEIEILALHEKLDRLLQRDAERQAQLDALLAARA